MKDSSIQWTDHTFNPWEGCTKVAPECKNCYAEVLVDKRFARAKWGAGNPRRRTSAATWRQPIRWNLEPWICEKCGEGWSIPGLHPGCDGEEFHRARVFCLSLGDWLDEEVPIEWLSDLLKLIYSTPNLDWLLLTKRPGNFWDRIRQVFWHVANDRNDPHFLNWLAAWRGTEEIEEDGVAPEPPANVWIGVSAGADKCAALGIPARIHFLSFEPMLSALDPSFQPTQKFDWIIFGGESGKNARLCWVDWIREGVAFCRINNIAPFVKQLGKNVGGRESDKWVTRLRDSHGGDMSEWPEDLRIREFPDPNLRKSAKSADK